MIRSPILLVECDFGRLGTAYLETSPEEPAATDIRALARCIADGQHERVLSVHRIDFASGTVTDVTADVLGEAEAMRGTEG